MWLKSHFHNRKFNVTCVLEKGLKANSSLFENFIFLLLICVLGGKVESENILSFISLNAASFPWWYMSTLVYSILEASGCPALFRFDTLKSHVNWYWKRWLSLPWCLLSRQVPTCWPAGFLKCPCSSLTLISLQLRSLWEGSLERHQEEKRTLGSTWLVASAK